MEFLKVEKINSSYGDIEVLHNVSFSLQDNEIVSIIGGNGAGKTTLLKTISGILRPVSGCIMFKDMDITNTPPNIIVSLGLVQIPEGRKLFSNLSVLENLELGAYTPKARQVKDDNLVKVFKLFPVLSERSGQLAGTLSGGEQQMLAIGRGLMSLPKILMLDEPSLGLAPKIVRVIFGALKETLFQGIAILLVEQNVQQSLILSNRSYVLENGAVVLEGPSKDLLKNDYVRKAYLGI
jgi:branched-chain amino acid transport system ATP-binding protein